MGKPTSVLIEHKDKERSKGVIHWLPPTYTKEGATEIARAISKDSEAEALPIANATDKWTFLYRENNNEIHHFINLRLKGTHNTEQQIWITLPGRRTQCEICGEDIHWVSQCLQKKNKKPTTRSKTPGPTQKEPQPPQTNVSDSNDSTDGFTEVDSRWKRKKQAAPTNITSPTTSDKKIKETINKNAENKNTDDELQ
uniref:Uncharacterized protein n=1 Tax=Arion vulgaris TaxID=1028688 RepID=A0A0B7B6T9_9EUPU